MPITSVTKDPEAASMTVVAEFPCSVERLWNAYADPRQIEKFWGPVEWPATFTRHDMAVGGRSVYTMRGPGGEESSGYWEFLAVDHGRSFEVRDGFADGEGEPNAEMPSMTMTFTFEAVPTGSRVTSVTYFGSLETLEQLVGMGMEDGMRSAMSQMDAVLADLAAFASDLPVQATFLSDTQVRISRVVRGAPELVWRAYMEVDLMKKWMLGPDGWEITEAVVALTPGDTHRTVWAPVAGGPAEGQDGFGFEGELLAINAPFFAVTTERMIGLPDQTVNELTLTPYDGGTLVTVLITYPSRELRDMVFATGMTDGMEASYARLEQTLTS